MVKPWRLDVDANTPSQRPTPQARRRGQHWGSPTTWGAPKICWSDGQTAWFKSDTARKKVWGQTMLKCLQLTSTKKTSERASKSEATPSWFSMMANGLPVKSCLGPNQKGFLAPDWCQTSRQPIGIEAQSTDLTLGPNHAQVFATYKHKENKWARIKVRGNPILVLYDGQRSACQKLFRPPPHSNQKGFLAPDWCQTSRLIRLGGLMMSDV